MIEAPASPLPEFNHSARRQFKWINVIFVVAAGLGSIMYGYSSSVISTTLIQPSFIKTMELDTRDDANAMIGLTGSVCDQQPNSLAKL